MESVDCLGYYFHFDSIDSSNPRTWYIFPSVCIIFYFFHQHLIVFGVQVFASFGRFIPTYFIPFDVMVNEIVALISSSDLLLLAHGNAIDSCVLILYPATLLNSLKSSSGFLVASLEFSVSSAK